MRYHSLVRSLARAVYGGAGVGEIAGRQLFWMVREGMRKEPLGARRLRTAAMALGEGGTRVVTADSMPAH